MSEEFAGHYAAIDQHGEKTTMVSTKYNRRREAHASKRMQLLKEISDITGTPCEGVARNSHKGLRWKSKKVGTFD